MRQATKNELRCECRRQPLLAIYGIDDKNRPYLHVKIYKARRIFGEVLITRGDIELRCRECLRWYKVTITATNPPRLIETPEPETIDEDRSVGLG